MSVVDYHDFITRKLNHFFLLKKQCNLADSLAEISEDGLIQAIVSEIERLQHEQFHSTTGTSTVTLDNLLLHHRGCNSENLNKVLAEFGPEFPTVELGAAFDGDLAPSDCDIGPPKTNINRVMCSNIREYAADFCADICPTSNNCGSGVEENSTITAKIIQLQKNNLGLNGQIKQRYETILEFPKQLNTEHEFHQLNVPTIDQQLQLPLQTKARCDQIRRGETEASTRKPRDSPKRSKIHTCGECKKEFNRKSNLVLHLRVHSGEKPHKCKDCDSSFSQLSNLRTHQLVHSGEKPYKCKDCNSAFIQPSSLRTHQRIHSGDKPYKCNDCNSAFSRSGSLRRHQRIHSGEKPYQCKDCKSGFRQLAHLKGHQRTHSGEKPYKCKD